MKKASERFTCCFCADDRTDAEAGDYVEVEVTFPGTVGPMRQLFGAHVGCFHDAASPAHRIEVPLA